MVEHLKIKGLVKRSIQKNWLVRFNIFNHIEIQQKRFERITFAEKNQQDKFIVVLKGKILDVAVDLRKKSKTLENTLK